MTWKIRIYQKNKHKKTNIYLVHPFSIYEKDKTLWIYENNKKIKCHHEAWTPTCNLLKSEISEKKQNNNTKKNTTQLRQKNITSTSNEKFLMEFVESSSPVSGNR